MGFFSLATGRLVAALRATAVTASTLCLGLSMAGSAGAQAYKFDTVAGGFLGDGLSAPNAALTAPVGIVFDAGGNLYVTESQGSRIRKIDTAGVISTFAGTGEHGFGGDNGAATKAVFRDPLGLAIDASGNIYVSDSLNHRVRKITPTGVISTVAGNGKYETSGDGGQARNAGIKRPYGLTFDGSGNLYIAESLGHRVRKVTPAGIISTVAGGGSLTGDGIPATQSTLNEPTGVALDSSGNLYITDSKNFAVRRVTPSGDIEMVLSGIAFPYGIARGPDDKIYVANDCFIRRIDAVQASTIVAGAVPDEDGACSFGGDGGPAINAGITLSEGIAFDAAGDLFFADSSSFRVRKISGGIIDTVVGRGNFFGDGAAATAATFSTAQGLAIGPDGSLFIADSYINGRVRKVDPSGVVHTVAGNGDFASSGDGGQASLASFLYPRGVMLDVAGNLYITERLGNSVRKVGSNGIVSTVASGLSRPNRTAIDRLGNLYIAETNRKVVKKLSPGGTMTIFAGQEVASPVLNYGDGGPATNASLASPTAVVVDPLGNVYIADGGYGRIRKVNPAGIITTVAGSSTMTESGPVPNDYGGDGGLAINAGLRYSTGMALDPFGNLYIAGRELRKVTPDGMISTVRGITQYAYDVAVDPAGAVYVATLDGRVLKGIRGPVAAADFNGDGYSDVMWRHRTTGVNSYWPTANVSLARNVTTVADQNWRVFGSGDFNADGRADLLWRNDATGASSIWPSANRALSYSLTRITDLAWKIVGIGDFDGDGKADILWRNLRTGANAIWKQGNSATQLTIASVTSQSWKVAGVGDFDGDGRSDILWRNSTTGANSIWLRGSLAYGQHLLPVSDQRWQIAGVGDFNGDGRSDILWHKSDGSSAIWGETGSLSVGRSLTRVTDTQWKIVAVGDYNGDGNSDLLWRHARDGRNIIWKSGNSSTPQLMAGVTNATWQIVD